MRRLLLILGSVMMAALVGCGDDEVTTVEPEDLSPPLGLLSITGDGAVTLSWWCSNFEGELVGYVVYMYEGAMGGDPVQEVPVGFTAVDSVEWDGDCNGRVTRAIGGLTNGTTYSFLVVAAKDGWSDISHTSNIIEDTPRPETATTFTLYAKQVDATEAGFEMSPFGVVDCTGIDVNYDNAAGGDVMCERFNPGAGTRLWVDGINEAMIQDVGYLADWDDADMAPSAGYADTGHSVEALWGHVYAVKTPGNHYAKIQIMDMDVDAGWIEIKAAYQTQLDNRQYSQ